MPDRDGLAVPASGSPLAPLDRVRQGVAVVEHLAARRPSVRRSLAGPRRRRRPSPGSPARRARAAPAPRGSSAAAGSVLDEPQDLGVGDEAALDDLAQPGDELGARQGGSRSRSQSTPAGSWKAPTRFLPAAVLIPVLPPTAASTIASSVVGTCTTRHAAQPGGGDEAAEVRGRSAAEGDHRVGAGEPGLRPAPPSRSAATAAVLAASPSGSASEEHLAPSARSARARAGRASARPSG